MKKPTLLGTLLCLSRPTLFPLCIADIVTFQMHAVVYIKRLQLYLVDEARGSDLRSAHGQIELARGVTMHLGTPASWDAKYTVGFAQTRTRPIPRRRAGVTYTAAKCALVAWELGAQALSMPRGQALALAPRVDLNPSSVAIVALAPAQQLSSPNPARSTEGRGKTVSTPHAFATHTSDMAVLSSP
ncbi:hypothetical protein PSPO01_03025 [Paraphaeosphaeria sporulosa]